MHPNRTDSEASAFRVIAASTRIAAKGAHPSAYRLGNSMPDSGETTYDQVR